MAKMMRSDRKPPLARSPIRLRPRRVLQPPTAVARTPPGSLTKSQSPKRDWDTTEEWELRPEYRSISCELRALAKMVHQEFGSSEEGNAGCSSALVGQRSPLFERGRLYEEYSARRNERLKRKKGVNGEEKKPGYDLGVRVESAKRRDVKKFESLRRSIPATPMTERREIPRYSLRSSSSKENKKPPLAMGVERSAGTGVRKTAARRTRNI